MTVCCFIFRQNSYHYVTRPSFIYCPLQLEREFQESGDCVIHFYISGVVSHFWHIPQVEEKTKQRLPIPELSWELCDTNDTSVGYLPREESIPLSAGAVRPTQNTHKPTVQLAAQPKAFPGPACQRKLDPFDLN